MRAVNCNPTANLNKLLALKLNYIVFLAGSLGDLKLAQLSPRVRGATGSRSDSDFMEESNCSSPCGQLCILHLLGRTHSSR
jgi:hypothetical protein